MKDSYGGWWHQPFYMQMLDISWYDMGLLTTNCQFMLKFHNHGVFCSQVNCYSLNSVGPSVENICGTRRFFTIYFASAVASKSLIESAWKIFAFSLSILSKIIPWIECFIPVCCYYQVLPWVIGCLKLLLLVHQEPFLDW